MGLDITAYSKLVAALDAEVDENGYPLAEGLTRISDTLIDHTNKEFPGHAIGLTPGVCSYEGAISFRAGSYGGYNNRRDWLALISGWGSAEACWTSDKTYGPFYELINFSDCEGLIGPAVSTKLAQDFAEFQMRAEERAAAFGEAYFLELYANWRKAFELAADGGAVRFA